MKFPKAFVSCKNKHLKADGLANNPFPRITLVGYGNEYF